MGDIPLMLILFYAALYGFAMKMADLFDEHKMRWFKGDAILFGILWGLFGVLLILSRADIANVILAMILAFLVRMRLDYRNHVIASAMIIIAFIWKSTFDIALFSTFFAVFVVFGGLKDILGDYKKRKDWFTKIYEIGWIYIVPTAIYGIFTNKWILFHVFIVYTIFYDLVKYGLHHMKKYRRL